MLRSRVPEEEDIPNHQEEEEKPVEKKAEEEEMRSKKSAAPRRRQVGIKGGETEMGVSEPTLVEEKRRIRLPRMAPPPKQMECESFLRPEVVLGTESFEDPIHYEILKQPATEFSLYSIDTCSFIETSIPAERTFQVLLDCFSNGEIGMNVFITTVPAMEAKITVLSDELVASCTLCPYFNKDKKTIGLELKRTCEPVSSAKLAMKVKQILHSQGFINEQPLPVLGMLGSQESTSFIGEEMSVDEAVVRISDLSTFITDSTEYSLDAARQLYQQASRGSALITDNAEGVIQKMKTDMGVDVTLHLLMFAMDVDLMIAQHLAIATPAVAFYLLRALNSISEYLESQTFISKPGYQCKLGRVSHLVEEYNSQLSSTGMNVDSNDEDTPLLRETSYILATLDSIVKC